MCTLQEGVTRGVLKFEPYPILLETMWQKLLKHTGLGVIALLCLLSYVYWPQTWVIATGVTVVMSLAWLSELRSSDSQLPANSRTVLITGCDTGNIQFNAVIICSLHAIANSRKVVEY